jgi:hypothetical protein
MPPYWRDLWLTPREETVAHDGAADGAAFGALMLAV